MKATAWAIAAFIAIASPAFAEAGGVGAGTVSCTTFAKRYAENPKVEELYFSWAQGFMTGLNFASIAKDGSSTDLSGMTLSDQEGWVRQYCDNHPLAFYSTAARDLYKSLPPSKTLNMAK